VAAAAHGADDGTQDGETPPAPEPDTLAPDLLESLRQLGATGRATWGAGSDAAKALRILVAADLSLARSALGRMVAFTGVAIAFGGSAWLLLMATLVAWLSLGLGWSWTVSLLLTGVASLALAGLAVWLALRYFDHARLKATRRQLARLGIGELAGLLPGAASRASTEAAAERVADATEGEPPKKGLGVDITPP
jgi:hypothetical protein